MSLEPEQPLNSKQLWHPRAYAAVVGFVLVGVFLGATHIKEPASWAAFRVTFETLNGATWPAEFERLHDEIADELKKDHAEPKRAA